MTLALAYSLGARALGTLPTASRYGTADLGGAGWYLLNRSHRRSARANYAAVLGLPEDAPEVKRVTRRAFQNYARMLSDIVLVGRLAPERLQELVTITGRAGVDTALAGGRGCILAVPHMGSWDVGAAYAGVLGYRMAAVAERFPGSLDRAVVGSRRRLGVEVIPLDRATPRRVLAALAANSVVALLSDLHHEGGVEVEFFGRRVRLAGGPAGLARRAGSPVIPACVYPTTGGRYHVHLDPPLPAPAGSGGKAAEAALTQQVAARFERFIGERPEQWFAFKPLFEA